MRLIVISTDTIYPDEGAVLNSLFHEGMPWLHLRKPFASEAALERLLQTIDASFYERIVLHEHFELLHTYPLKGIHLNKRNPDYTIERPASLSRSCHSLEEVTASVQTVDYVFLSPLFDSISKQGYKQAFTHEQLMQAKERQIIHDRVIGLGGLDETTIPQISAYGFGGVAVLGALWGVKEDKTDMALLQKRLNKLRTITETA